MNRQRASWTGEIDDVVLLEFGDVIVRKAADPLPVGIVLVIECPRVAAADHTQRALAVITIVEVQSDCTGAEIGVRPEADILVPFHFFTASTPFEIELGVMKLDVRPDEIGHDVKYGV